MQLNEQQNDVLNWVGADTGSLNLIARAGCGKTTTLIEVVEEIGRKFPGTSTFMGAFNKAIAGEIAAKLKARAIDWRQAEAGTMHSIGFRLWRKVANDVKVDEKKVLQIIDRLANERPHEMAFISAANAVRSAVSLAKQSGFGWLKDVEDRAAWFELFDYFGIESDSDVAPAEIVEASIVVLKASYAADRAVIDYDDMIAAPIVHNVAVRYPYDFVLIDEAQDTNAARRTLALKLLRPVTGRMIAVGDDRQAIYGFTGADSDAMTLIRRELNSKQLPLNVTYRCPKAIVREAQRYVPDITAHASAPEGAVRRALSGEIDFKQHSRDAVLCRNTAPLIKMAYELIARKIPCRVEGRDIGKSLQLLAKRWKVKTLAALRNKLDDYLQRETAKWLAKGREEKVAAVEDKVTSVLALIDVCTAEGKTEVCDLTRLIETMFGDTAVGQQSPVLTLSTVHKAKGREWPTVFILRAKEFMPSKWARKEWQQLQEQNLIYVAITRAQQNLIYLD